ncbi:hypothetical protein RJT34_11494 [Clitoria ternatea]|uniref:Uncharacterized protein n=1 Tax=Clitoria ternatea TaxID=43366 RepID=A0AAN9JM61_CLITE
MVDFAVEKARRGSPAVIEAAFDSEPGKHQPTKPRSRSKPEKHDLFDTNQRPFDSVRQTLLSAELVASQKHLPLLHHGVAVLNLRPTCAPP